MPRMSDSPPARSRPPRVAWKNPRVASPQTLSEAERRLVAVWAADCAERVLPLFEAEAPDDDSPRDAIARTCAYARGELDTAGQIRRRFVAGRGARDVSATATAAARAPGQAVVFVFLCAFV